MEDPKTKLAEEQEKVIALETYSRRENLRFMNIPKEPGEKLYQHNLWFHWKQTTLYRTHAATGGPESEKLAPATTTRPLHGQ